MPVILSSALIHGEGRVLLARRNPERPPFARQWLLPSTVVRREESAEEALARHLERELGLTIGEPVFAETIYLEDPPAGERYVTNVFRVAQPPGELRFRAHGDYDDLRWLLPDEVAALDMPAPLRDWLLAVLRAEADAPPVGLEAARAAAAALSQADLTYAERKRRLYVQYAQTYDEDQAAWLGEEGQARLVTFLTQGLEPGMRVLDAGCGTGVHLRAISEAIGREGACVGMDISPEMLALARRRLIFAKNFALRVCDLSHGIPLQDAWFDAVIAAGVVDQLPDADLFFADVRRVLRPGGFLAATVACYEDDSPAERAHAEASRDHDLYYRPYQEIVSAVRRAGLTVESVEFAPSEPTPLGAEVERRFELFIDIAQKVRARGFDPETVRLGSAMIRAQREG
ncbi:MAG: methyltransferase domain-containing protein [Dehalococcoidia bacterium]